MSSASPDFNLSILIIIPTLVGLFTLPVLSPLGDLYSKKIVMLITYLISFFASFGIAILGFFQIFHLVTITFLLCIINACNAVVSPIFNSGLVEIAENGQVETAFRLERIFSSLTMLFAPILSALIISFGSIYMALSIDALGFLMAFILISFISFHKKHGNITHQHMEGWIKMLADGFKIKFIIKLELFWGVIVAFLNFFITPFITFTFPYFLKNNLHAEVSYLGISQSFYCMGTLIGSIWLIRVLNRILTKDLVCMLAVGLEGIALILTGLLGTVFPLAVPLCMLLLGASIVIHNVTGDTSLYGMIFRAVVARSAATKQSSGLKITRD